MQENPTRRDVRNQRNKRRQRRVLFSTIALFVVVGGTFGAYHELTKPLTRERPVYAKVRRIVLPKPPAEADRTTMLLIGTDTRPGDANGNSDVLMLCSIDNKNKRVEILSIPRDTKVQYPNGTMSKINKGLQLGGPTMAVNLVETLIGIPVDYYVLTHFTGLVRMIDTIGGITLNVPERMLYNTGDKEYNIIDLKPGTQTLNGTQALGFVRFRHDALGDIGRTQRQQVFLSALEDKLLSPDNVTKLPTLVSELGNTFETDFTLVKLGELASLGNRYRGYSVIHETLPGAFHNSVSASDPSYWIVNPAQAKYEAAKFFYQGQVVKNSIQNEAFTVNWSPPRVSSSGQTNPVSNSTVAQSSTDSSQPSTSVGITMRLNVLKAGLRTGPGTAYGIINSLSEGDKVSVLKELGSWYEIETQDGITGYVQSKYLAREN